MFLEERNELPRVEGNNTRGRVPEVRREGNVVVEVEIQRSSAFPSRDSAAAAAASINCVT